MPRKTKNTKIAKEYGVKGSKHHKKEPEFIQNQIVQIDLNPDKMQEQPTDPLQYNPEITEPKGMLEAGMDEYQTIKQDDVKSVQRKNDINMMNAKRNEEIQRQLEQHKKKYQNDNSQQMLQWVDLESSSAFKQNLHNWPNVNLPCFWCLETFSTMPWPLVVGRTKDGKFIVRGHHCSPNCALANGLDSREMSESIAVSDIYSLNQAFVYKVTGDYGEIRPSPPRMMMQKFGGPLSLDKFRLESGMKNFSSYLTYPPLETSLPVWNRIKTEDTNNVDGDDQLVLKRTKPFFDQSQSLDSLWSSRGIQ